MIDKSDLGSGLEIAVIGMSVRIPGAETLNDFWQNLSQGKECISVLTDEQLLDSGINKRHLDNDNYVKAKGILNEGMGFEPELFGYSYRESRMMDPQLRVYHECVFQALLDACYQPKNFDGAIGIYGGAGSNPLWGSQFFSDDINSLAAGYEVVNFNSQEYFNTRIAHCFNLTGPAITVQTACSSSLVAIHLASQGLIAGDCDMAIAGGVEMSTNALLNHPDIFGYFHQEGMISSTDGHCRVFDEKASGTVFGDGGGCVVLKRLDDAIADGDNIHAIIKGSAINNDGSSKVGFTAPSVSGQVQVIQAAQEMAEIDAESITYVEAHGTGTSLGDPVEIKALTEAFSSDKRGFCQLGSVKSNVGHLGAAAGVVGFIKTVLSLKNKQIPESLHYHRPNPDIDFSSSPFEVNNSLTPWLSDAYPLRAGVSSFGIGGTNAHVIVEECPEGLNEGSVKSSSLKAFYLSASNDEALAKQSKNLSEFLIQNTRINMNDLEYSLKVGREHLAKRQVVFANNREQLINGLINEESSERLMAISKRRNVVFMFPGQGAQYQGMALDLYLSAPYFKRCVDTCFSGFDKALEKRLKTIFFEEHEDNSIDNTEFTQPLLFIVEYSLAKYLIHIGISPWAMVGHSVGEYVAATLSGVFSLQDALVLVALRGRLMAKTKPGRMLAINRGKSDTLKILPNELSIAAINTHTSCVVSGEENSVGRFMLECQNSGIDCKLLPTNHAYHSKLMEPVLDEFRQAFDRVSLRMPTTPYLSNLTGDWVNVEDAKDPGYWQKHLRHEVCFAKNIETLGEHKNLLFLEIGPGRTLSTFVQKLRAGRDGDIRINLLASRNEKDQCKDIFTRSIARINLNGNDISWENYYEGESRKRLSLPGYIFNRTMLKPLVKNKESHDITSEVTDSNLAQLYVPQWRRSQAFNYDSAAFFDDENADSKWLLFVNDDEGYGQRIATMLKTRGCNLTTVTASDSFSVTADGNYTIDIENSKSYHTLFDSLQKSDRIPEQILHFLSASNPSENSGFIQDELNAGFFSLIYIAQSIGHLGINASIQLSVISSELHSVTGEESIAPAKATMLGAVKVISQEYPSIECRNIDVGRVVGNPDVEPFFSGLMAELMVSDSAKFVALRGQYRWERSFHHMSSITASMNARSIAQEQLIAPGHYLITGGLGGIGMALANMLAKQAAISLTLVSRRRVIDRDQWQTWLQNYSSDNATSKVILAIEALEKTGCKVLPVQADVCDEASLRRAISHSIDVFGPLKGVIHAAGVASGAMIQFKHKAAMDEVLGAKVIGTYNLSKALASSAPDFVCLCSSVTSILGGVGQADYCAANSYLDACVDSGLFSSSERVFSVNWDAWKEVGMAVDVAKNGGVALGKELHPLIGAVVAQTDNDVTFKSRFSVDENWLLDEHRILDQPTAPGTAYIEMARAAFSYLNGDMAIEFSDIYFLTPLLVKNTEWRSVTTQLNKDVNGYSFTVSSQLFGTGDRIEHSRGKLRVLNTVGEDVRDVDSLWASYEEKDLVALQESITERSDSDDQKASFNAISLGAHWNNFKRVGLADKKGIANLKLLNGFENEVSEYKLHPSMLDCATAFLSSFVEAEFYFPLFYKCIKQYRPLTPECYSEASLVSRDTKSQGTLTFDISIYDTSGILLMQVEGFSMRKISDDFSDRSLKNSADLSDNTYDDGNYELNHGLSTSEALSAFRQVLENRYRSVVVTTSDINDAITNSSSVDLLSHDQDDIVEQARSRPELETAFVSPKSVTEKKLAKLWETMLGVNGIGIHDNYFDLGGDSLTLMQIHSKLSSVTEKNIAIAELYNYSTIKSFSEYIDKEDSGVNNQLKIADDRAKKMKSAMKKRRKIERVS